MLVIKPAKLCTLVAKFCVFLLLNIVHSYLPKVVHCYLPVTSASFFISHLQRSIAEVNNDSVNAQAISPQGLVHGL